VTESPTIFTRIITGELPGRFVWRDESVVAFLTIAPIRPGHVLVVPIEQTDRFTDVDPTVWVHAAAVARDIGRVLEHTFDCARVGLIVAGLEVPHCHIHLVPIASESDLDFAKADHGVPAEELDDAADRIRAALRDAGHGAVVPAG
jgi:diadenosine tetraphosphate (Ap4A) HIT family hydrolase